ncbi:hypothetical protein [Enterobacter hormaechei]|uniref:hypothetical protein n=1 Tax=Enterobacter hormaechei TaxID=158836 RepID=UPI002FE56D90
MTNNQLTAEQLVTLQLRIMSALSFYQQRPEKEAKRMAELLTLAGAAASELQERRKSDVLPAPQPSKMSGIMPDYEGVAMTQRECYQAGKEAGLTEAGRFPVIPSGYALVPVNPTEDMIVEGFESAPDKFFSDENVWAEYEKMSGCQKAAHRARLCWNAMLAAAPKLENI